MEERGGVRRSKKSRKLCYETDVNERAPKKIKKNKHTTPRTTISEEMWVKQGLCFRSLSLSLSICLLNWPLQLCIKAMADPKRPLQRERYDMIWEKYDSERELKPYVMKSIAVKIIFLVPTRSLLSRPSSSLPSLFSLSPSNLNRARPYIRPSLRIRPTF